MSDSPTPTETETVEGALRELTLREKVELCTGRDMWSTMPIERIGLRSMVLADGPTGVRGKSRDERFPSLCLPSGTALGAAWDPGAAAVYGTHLAREAHRKGVHVVLGPTVNLHRSPLGGRSFEAVSEDPHLTGRISQGYVRGLQSQGVAASVKHYLGNDSETERIGVDVHIDERALREVYLRAFEPAVVDAAAWTVMSSYNSVNGAKMTESELLTTPLKDEWGFDGVVVSDWTAVDSLDSALAGQDLVMPGPNGPWGDALIAAVEAGTIPVATVDEKVRRILTLAHRVGALGAEPSAKTDPRTDIDPQAVAFVERSAAAGMVLLANDGVLPLAEKPGMRIAVVGPNAIETQSQGGGSASVVPPHVVSALDGIRKAFPSATVEHAVGSMVRHGLTALPARQIINPRTDGEGVLVRFLGADGTEVWAEDRHTTRLVWFSGEEHYVRAANIELRTRYTPEETGVITFGYAANGHSSLYVDDVLVHDVTMASERHDLGAAISAPAETSVRIDVREGESIDLRLVADVQRPIPGSTALAVTLGFFPEIVPADVLIARAVEVASAADIALVVVGTDSIIESEGYDRTTLALPGSQDDLVRAVAAANPRTVAIVNSGAPVELPWVDDVAAVLVTWFAGQEIGSALGRVVSGEWEPGGRLPTTWPRSLDQAPVSNVTPTEHRLDYDEGIHVGYRAWLRDDREPAFAFGFGLGYTTWNLGAPVLVSAEGGNTGTVSVPVTNTGTRPGRHVVQVYASRADSGVDRPALWLVGFGAVALEPGATETLVIDVDSRDLRHWDNGGWALEAGVFDLHVATSATDLAGSVHWAPRSSEGTSA